MTMKKFIEPKSDQLNADDLIIGKRIIRITKVKVTETGTQDCTISYEGDNGKPYKPCKGMGKIIVHAWGENPQNYVGKYLELFRNPEVRFGKDKVGGIEISAMSDIPAEFEFALTVSRGFKKPVKIKKLSPPAATASSQPAALPEIPAALKQAGTDAAAGGVAAFVKWRDALTAEDKELMRPYNSMWSSAAKAADAAALAAGGE